MTNYQLPNAHSAWRCAEWYCTYLMQLRYAGHVGKYPRMRLLVHRKRPSSIKASSALGMLGYAYTNRKLVIR